MEGASGSEPGSPPFPQISAWSCRANRPNQRVRRQGSLLPCGPETGQPRRGGGAPFPRLAGVSSLGAFSRRRFGRSSVAWPNSQSLFNTSLLGGTTRPGPALGGRRPGATEGSDPIRRRNGVAAALRPPRGPEASRLPPRAPSPGGRPRAWSSTRSPRRFRHRPFPPRRSSGRPWPARTLRFRSRTRAIRALTATPPG
jgi:hypothetical protein